MGTKINCAIVFILLAAVAGNIYAQELEVGVFLRKEKNCTVISDGITRACTDGQGLFSGDMVKTPRKKESLKIQWISKSALLESTQLPGQYRVIFHSPREKKGLLGAALDILGFARESSKATAIAATRDAAKARSFVMPGQEATLLAGSPATFSWCGGSGEKLVIRDDHGTVVFERRIKGLSSLRITPEEAGIGPGADYFWAVTGTGLVGLKLRLLDSETSGVIAQEFAAIGTNEKLAENDKVLARAAFVQYLSDSFPGEVSLGWLCHQLVDLQKEKFTPEQKKVAEYLEERSGMSLCKR